MPFNSIDDIAAALAGRAVALRSVPPTYAEKVAFKASDVLTSLGGAVRDNPTLAGALLGGGTGALAGGVGTALGNRGRDDKDRKSVFDSALTGGLAGAGLGGGLGAAAKAYGDSGKGQGLGTGDSLPPGQYTDPATGKRMQIDSDTLRKNPALLDKVRDLSKPQPLYESAPQKAWELAKNVFSDTYSGKVVPGIAAADFAIHNQKLNTGDWHPLKPVGKPLEWLGGKLNSPKLQGAGTWLSDRRGVGMINEMNSRIPEHTRLGFEKIIQDKNVGEMFTPEKRQLAQDVIRNPEKLRQMAKDVKNRDGGYQGRVRVMKPQADVIVDATTTDHTGKVPQTTRQVPLKQPDKAVLRKTEFTPEEVRLAVREGAKASAGLAAGNKALGEAHNVPRIFKGPLGDRELPHSPWSRWRGARRLGAYAAVPFVEYGYRNWQADQARQKELNQIASQFARPVEGK
jgi:hypothetical protein